jgi:uncharacterized lipoprotein YddW (UPF0748 family)
VVVAAAVAGCVAGGDPPQTPRVIFPTSDRTPTAMPPTPLPKPTFTPRPTPVADPVTEYRALWVDGFNNGLKTPAQVSQLIQDCQSISCNVLMVQMRIHANALHALSEEPRVDYIAPGFDPLTDVISKAHAISPPIDVYAWMNALPAWPVDADPPSDPRHVFNAHGAQASAEDNWMALNEQGNLSGTGLTYLDPGHPAAAAHVAKQVVNVVKNYAVDGVHLDFIRYGGLQWGYNPTSVTRFNTRYNKSGTPAPGDAQWSQWRRDQVTALVRRIWLESTAAKARIKVSAALIPWGDAPANDLEWQSSSAYSTVFQDWRAWLQEGILDIGFPMNYWPDSTQAASLDHWIEFERTHRYNRHVVVGLGSYMNTLEESLAQIRRVRGRSTNGARADGVALYVYNQTDRDRLPFAQFVEATTLGLTPSPATPVFAPRAYLPSMPWKSMPTTGHLMGMVTTGDKPGDGAPRDGATVTLTGPSRRTTTADGNGFYGFVDVTPGAYRITAGGATMTTTVRAGAVETVNLKTP